MGRHREIYGVPSFARPRRCCVARRRRLGGYGETWGDLVRYGEIWGDMRRYSVALDGVGAWLGLGSALGLGLNPKPDPTHPYS